MFVVKVLGTMSRPVVTREGLVEFRGDDARVIIRTWMEDEGERLEIVSEPWRDEGNYGGDYDVSQSVTIYRGPMVGDGTQPGAVDEPLKIRCPRPTCGHTWTARTRRPNRCPKCWLRLVR